MKKIIALLLVLSMLFVFGCASKEDNASVDKAAETQTSQNDASEEAEKEEKAPVETDHIKEADDIETGDELTALIEEINDEKTSPERKAELLELVGEFLGGMEGQSVSLPAEE